MVGLAADGELAVDDGAAEAAFGVVVGRGHAGTGGEGPEGGPGFEQAAGEAAAALVAGCSAAVLAQERLELAAQPADGEL